MLLLYSSCIILLYFYFFNKGSSHEIVMKFNRFLTLLSSLLVRYVFHDELKASQLPKTENHIHELTSFFFLHSKTIGKRKLD